MNGLKLLIGGKVTTENGKVFTKLVGGFGDDKPMFTIWQSAELLGMNTKSIKENYDNNISNFEENVDSIDLKSALDESDSEKNVDITKFLKEAGYSQNKLNATKQWLIFSLSGMMKLVKIATSKESWNIYNNFLEDYFKTKAENTIMKKTLVEEIKELEKDKALFIGMSVVEKDEMKKIEWLNKMNNIDIRIKKLEKIKSQQEIIKEYETEITIGKDICNSNHCFDIGSFAKILNIGMGKGLMFKWLREKEILMFNNEPYQQYMKYFKVIPLPNNRFADSKTLIKSNGVKYIVGKLIKEGKLVTKSVDEILSELDPVQKTA